MTEGTNLLLGGDIEVADGAEAAMTWAPRSDDSPDYRKGWALGEIHIEAGSKLDAGPPKGTDEIKQGFEDRLSAERLLMQACLLRGDKTWRGWRCTRSDDRSASWKKGRLEIVVRADSEAAVQTQGEALWVASKRALELLP